MSLEAIAAPLRHRSMKMTLTYARITDTTIAASTSSSQPWLSDP